ncbi:MAG: NPCBM/NEW2 domain-containing protein [Firmicutes bacterium]|nr:NPCBM/NEW2 domain-containing protein [Bacillota bacterium]
MKRTVGFILGIVTGTMAIAGASYASTGVQHIKASFAHIGVSVNGKAVTLTAQPFIYDKNVYVPVSTVGHALGAKVAWVNKPAGVTVTAGPARVQTLQVYDDGKALPSGITDGKTFYDVPALDAQYAAATGLSVSVDKLGDVNFMQASAPTLAGSGSPLLALKPALLSGDFANTTLYPQGQLSGYWPASVLGQLYPGQYTIEWAVAPGQVTALPGLTYTLAGQYQSFSAQFAVDDLSKNFPGYVQLLVVGDGKTIGQSGWIQGGAAPTSVTANLTGVTTLRLVYEMKTTTGTIYKTGQSYTAPAVNVDGSKTDPIIVTDLMNATVSTTSSTQ